jgi:hypothetical protein
MMGPSPWGRGLRAPMGGGGGAPRIMGGGEWRSMGCMGGGLQMVEDEKILFKRS